MTNWEFYLALQTEISVVPPSRLITLITAALKWEQHQGHISPGTKYDLFHGIQIGKIEETDSHPSQLDRTIKVVAFFFFL